MNGMVWIMFCLYFCRMYELVSYKMGRVFLLLGWIDSRSTVHIWSWSTAVRGS